MKRSSHLVAAIPLILLLLFVGDLTLRKSQGPDYLEQRALSELSETETFSLGPVGVAGAIPQREYQFLRLATSESAVPLLESLFESGTPEARLYALAGLRHHSPTKFESYAERFADVDMQLSLQGGCFVHTASASDLVSALQDRDVLADHLRLRYGRDR